MPALRNGELGSAQSGPIPPEIMTLIFAHCRRSPQTRHALPPHSLPPITLSQVCHYWRTLCMDAPQLWADIITGYLGFHSAKAGEMIQTWAGRAEGCLLSVRHSPDLFGGMHLMVNSQENARYIEESRALTSAVSMLAPRIRRLELNVLESIVLSPVLFLLGTGLWNPSPPSSSEAEGGDSASSYSDLDFTVSFPVLEVLEIRSSQLSPIAMNSHQRGRALTSLHSTCPRLRSVRLQWPGVNLGQQVRVMRYMRNLDLEYCPSAEQGLRWVDVSPNLKHLKVTIFGQEGDAEEDGPEIDEFDGLSDDALEDALNERPISTASRYDPDDPLSPERYTEYDGLENGTNGGDAIVDTGRFEQMTLADSDEESVADSVPESHLAEKSTRKLVQLRDLDVTSFSSISDVNILLKALEAPALRSLKVSTYFALNRNMRWLTIMEFLMRSGCAHRLVEFEASGTPMQPEDVRGCLAMLDNLRSLKLNKLNGADQVLRFLTVPRRVTKHHGDGSDSNHGQRRRRESTSRRADATSVWGSAHVYLCPKLEVLDLTDTDFTVEVLADMVESRCNTKTYGTDFHKHHARFKMLKVDGKYLRLIRNHPQVADYVSAGKLKIREGEGNSCLNIWGP